MSLGRVCRASGFRPGLVYLSTTSRSFSVNHGRQAKVLTGESMNPFVKQIEYAVRGAIVKRAGEIEKEMAQGKSKPFKEVIKANIGDAHALGMKPLTYPRQVVSLAVNPELFNSSHIAKDAKAKVRRILDSVKGHSLGAYSDSKGLEIVRKDVARYIEKRDGFPANPDDIYLTNGASEGIRSMLKLVQTSQHYGEGRAGVMIPIPQYPLYSATLSELNSYQINYYLDEDNGWKLDINELRRALNEARPHCVPRALCVINPGNPTGQVLSHDNIQEIIQFAKEEGLFIMADEVYQANIYGKGKEFHSFKKVLRELGPEYSGVELASFHSTSKGYMGECGFRGGYMEVTGLDSEVKFHLEKMLSAKLCACLTGQIMMDTVVNPPELGDESYDVFVKEKSAVLNSFKVRAHLVAETFNAMEGISCNEVMGAMYAFPRIELPRRAIVEAKSRGLHPDSFYAMELLEKTGLCVVPGNGFGQREGTYHFRITILPQTDKLKTIFESFKVFHQEFMEKYRSDIGKKSAL